MSISPGAGVDGLQQAALLIDADNFSDAQAIDAAWAQLKARVGRVSVCRAYGNVLRLQTLAPLWRTLGARTFPNLSLEKNTTDAALIADAVALHFQQGVRWFGIASGDADFAPLAVRLREWGCQVWCFSMEGIVFAGVESYYDRVVRFSPPPPMAPVSAPVGPVTAPKSATPPASAAPMPAPPTKSPEVPVPAALAPATKSKPPQKAPPPPAAALPEMVQRILDAVPGLRDAPQMLNQVVPVLRQKAILAKTTKSTKFFAAHAAYFKLTPARQPTQLAYRPPRPMPSVPEKTPVGHPVNPPHEVVPCSCAPAEEPVVLSWPTAIPRQATPRLLAELNGLRSVLLQLASRRVSAADVLLAAPEVLQGQPCALSAVAGRLREKGLLRPYQSALPVLQRHPASFVVAMDRTPQTVMYLR